MRQGASGFKRIGAVPLYWQLENMMASDHARLADLVNAAVIECKVPTGEVIGFCLAKAVAMLVAHSRLDLQADDLRAILHRAVDQHFDKTITSIKRGPTPEFATHLVALTEEPDSELMAVAAAIEAPIEELARSIERQLFPFRGFEHDALPDEGRDFLRHALIQMFRDHRPAVSEVIASLDPIPAGGARLN